MESAAKNVAKIQTATIFFFVGDTRTFDTYIVARIRAIAIPIYQATASPLNHIFAIVEIISITAIV